MNSASGLESEIASVITGIILLFSACNAYIRYLVNKEKLEMEEQNKRQDKRRAVEEDKGETKVTEGGEA